MRQDSSISRYTILWVIILCYLTPIIILSLLYPLTDSWNLMSAGFLIATIGSLIIFWMLVRWESKLKLPSKNNLKTDIAKSNIDHADDLPIYSPPSANLETDQRISDLSKELEEALQANQKLKSDSDALAAQVQQSLLDKDQTLQQIQKTLTEWEEYRLESCRQMEQQQTHIQQLQGTIADQRSLLEKKQQQTGQLESKVGDLTYEIKTLLQLAEAHSGSIYAEPKTTSTSSFMPDYQQEEVPLSPPERQVRTPDEASLQLKRCLDIAQKITGSHRFNSQYSAFTDSPADTFALDLRRLCDSLRSENSCTILLYSPRENQLLFASNQIRTLSGWSPDKFMQNFADIVVDDGSWRQGITSLAMRSEAQIQLTLKTKSGHDILVKGHLGMIPTGIFRQHTIAVLYNSTTKPLQKV